MTGAQRDALAAALAASAGLPAGKAIWEGQGAPPPAPPYLSASILSSEALAQAARLVRAAAQPSPGAELEAVFAELVEDVARVQAFAASPGAAGELAEAARLGLQLDARLEGLGSVGLVLVGFGPVLGASAVVAAGFEARAFFDLTLRRARSASQPLAQIRSVGISSSAGDLDKQGSTGSQ